MALEKRPHNPLPSGYVPPLSKPYKVQDGDTWESVARKHGVDVIDLIYLNCKTTNFREVNWYLHNRVGCRVMTHNHHNWKFTSSAQPGIIHIPQRRMIMPPLVVTGHVPSRWDQVWAGFGESHSGDLFVVGAHDLNGKLYNLGDKWPEVRNVTISVHGYKFGLGLGGDVGAVFIIAHGFPDGKDMEGVDGDWDFDLALAAKLSDVLKGLKGIGRGVKTIEDYKKTRTVAEDVFKNRGIGKPGVYTIPIPLAGWGLHIWGGYKFGDIDVTNTGVGAP